ncbi:MAG: hypothetical protein J0H11_16590 [Rhizobiales bacterium]|nr:hypothetical protein [Hyphomicrobiales bacterium]
MSPKRLGDPLVTGRDVDGSILNRLQDEIERLPSALARIAKYIVENPEKALRQSVSQLGEYSGSGEASILRLCRQIGMQLIGFTVGRHCGPNHGERLRAAGATFLARTTEELSAILSA